MNSFLRNTLLLCFSTITFYINAQVVANFSMSPPNGCSPLNVSFTDLSSGGANTWNWTFGNGNNSPLQNPGAVYIPAGSYPVCLTASDGITSDTFCDTVIVYPDPVIDFIADNTSGCSNLDVNFTNLSITGSGIASVLWNFGDGNSSNLINPSHTFTTGIFNITLIVTDSSGCITQGDQLAYIESIISPIASFTAINTQNCSVPNLVNFTNTSTQNLGATYTWSFGDGSPISTLENPSHNYTAFGSYDVQLIVNKNGCIDTITQLNLVNLQAQDADFSVNNTITCAGQSVNFTDLSILTPSSWSWDFGDGSPVSTSQNPSHTYNTAGTFTVTMIAMLPGCNETVTKVNLITVNPNPTTTFSADATDTCSAPFLVNFTSISSPGVTYNWNFGDGTNSNVPNPSHTFTSNGSFNISLTVTDVNLCVATETFASYINVTPPVANFNIDSAFGCAPKTINITDFSTSGNTLTSWEWDFGDGNTQIGPSNPSHLYTDTGTYNISLIVIDNFGCTDTLDPGFDVDLGASFNVNFFATPGVSCRMDPIIFTNLTDTLLITDIEWLWSFGDGGIANSYDTEYQYNDTGFFSVSLAAIHNGCASDTTIDSIIRIFPPIALFTPIFDCIDKFNVEFQDASIGPETWTWDINGDSIFTNTTIYTFPDTGVYDITLYVENLTYGCLDSITQSITIVNPSVNFSYDDSIGCPPFNVNFTDLSTEATGWNWNFGDGGTSSQKNPSHSYTVPGIYDVQLIITSLNGCTDTLLLPQIINTLSTTVNFVANDTTGCRPFNINFTDISSSQGGGITNWLWDFGDGINSISSNPNHTYTDVGDFTVSLQITDSTGCIGTLVKPFYIRSTGPIPSFTNPGTICTSTLFNFNNTSSSLGGTITNWLWNFGDGNTSILENPAHEYTSSGNYDISLYIIDDNGCDSSLTKLNTIYVDSLVMDFTADSTVGSCPPFIVNFQELVSPNPTTWEWDFGNGTTSSVSNPSLVYNSVGDFDVQLIATNSIGCRDTIVKQNFITTNGPIGILNSSTDSGCIDLNVQFNIISNNSVSQVWDYGDGTVSLNNALTTSHIYTTVNTFYPLVILTDAGGCQFPYSFDSIQTGTMNADIYIDDFYVCAPGSISFADSTNSTQPPVSWNWNFGDGSTSNLQNPTHNYTSHGVFDISLIVDNGLCRDTVVVLQEVVSDTSTNAGFSIIPPALTCYPVLIQFTNNSSADSSITNWNWDFGNGLNDISQNPTSISYDSAGTYQVTIDITTIQGCTSQFTDSLIINSIPTFSIDLDTIELCFNEDTTINLNTEADITWTTNNYLSCDDCPNPTISGLSSTTFYVNAENEFGCTYDDTLELIVHQTPDLIVSEGETALIGSSVDMNAFSSSINTSTFNWSPTENLSCNDCANTTFTANENTMFTVSIQDEFGCSNSDTILIEVFDLCDGSSVYFPNIFTPNNDNLNDEFKATLRLNLIAEINHFRIFDRWGNVVFETNDITQGWDGNNPKGNYLNNGVYVYVLDMICPGDSNQLIQGNVTLLR
jgi:gliding motility-associated-like protein